MRKSQKVFRVIRPSRTLQLQDPVFGYHELIAQDIGFVRDPMDHSPGFIVRLSGYPPVEGPKFWYA